MRRRWVVLAVIAVAAVAAWYVVASVLNSDEAKIKRVIRGGAKALNEQNVMLFMAFISKDYRDGYGNANREILRQNVTAMIKLVKPGSLKVTSINVDVPEADRATATFFAHGEIAPSVPAEVQLLSQTHAAQRLRLTFRREQDGWRVTSARLLESTMD